MMDVDEIEIMKVKRRWTEFQFLIQMPKNIKKNKPVKKNNKNGTR